MASSFAPQQRTVPSAITAQLTAPLLEGTRVGEMKVSFEGNPLTSLPLVVLKPVLEGGVWTKVVSGLGQLLE